MIKLLRSPEMPRIEGLSTPSEFYTVIEKPALLAGMRYPPMDMSWDLLQEAGFTSIVCLTSEEPLYKPSPLRLLYAIGLEDLYGKEPYDPDEQEKLVREAAAAVLKGLEDGEHIVVHCLGGTGRTGTVLGCVLRGLGVPAPTVIRYLNNINVERGKDGWPESDWQAEMVCKY